jgi:hypothetical protein
MVSFPLHPFAHLEWDQEQRYSDKIFTLVKWKEWLNSKRDKKEKKINVILIKNQIKKTLG